MERVLFRVLATFREALNESWYYEGRNVVFEFRWAENQYDRLPDLARDLVARRVDVIVTTGNINTALAAGLFIAMD